MKVTKLKETKIKEFSRLAKEVIKNLNFYNREALRDCLKDFDENDLLRELNIRKNIFILAEENNKPLGFLWATCNNLTGIIFIEWIGVDNKFRNRGVATEMLDYLINSSRKNNKLHKIVCNVVTDNKKSLSFFKKNKFKKQTLFKKHWYKLDFYQYYKDL